jgi:glycosyltransferase involved in cell wall biosynthesis
VTGRPLVSVALPCFNAERFLPGALDSLLRQTYRDLEVLALDDGSSDATPRILERYAGEDTRVRIRANDRNLGLIPTLNRGVAEARGDFIARMDADDMAAPRRIERQVQALMIRPEVGIVGTGIELIDEAGGRSRRQAPMRCREPGAARFMALFATPLAHPTILARVPVMRAHPYGTSPDSLHTEDYDLFTRMLAAGVEFLNLDEPLVTVRVSEGSVSRRHEALQVANFVACARRHLERTLGFEPDPSAHRVLVNRMDDAVSARDLEAGLRCLDRVEAEFLAREPGSSQEVTGIADEQRVDILVQATLKGTPRVRLAAGRLAARYGRRLRSRRARRYLGAKLGRWIPVSVSPRHPHAHARMPRARRT